MGFLFWRSVTVLSRFPRACRMVRLNIYFLLYSRLRVVPHFFTRARVLLALLSLRKNGGLLVVSLYSFVDFSLALQ